MHRIIIGAIFYAVFSVFFETSIRGAAKIIISGRTLRNRFPDAPCCLSEMYRMISRWGGENHMKNSTSKTIRPEMLYGNRKKRILIDKSDIRLYIIKKNGDLSLDRCLFMRYKSTRCRKYGYPAISLGERWKNDEKRRVKNTGCCSCYDNGNACFRLTNDCKGSSKFQWIE